MPSLERSSKEGFHIFFEVFSDWSTINAYINQKTLAQKYAIISQS